MKRPGTVIAAAVLWIILGAASVLVAVSLFAAGGNETLHRQVVAQIGGEVAPAVLVGVGVLTLVVGLAYIVLAVLTLRARNWARIAVTVLGVLGVLTLFSFNVVMFALVAAAIVLQFLPVSNAYFTAAKQVR